MSLRQKNPRWVDHAGSVLGEVGVLTPGEILGNSLGIGQAILRSGIAGFSETFTEAPFRRFLAHGRTVCSVLDVSRIDFKNRCLHI